MGDAAKKPTSQDLIISRGKEILQEEAAAISAASTRLGASFASAIELISELSQSARIIVCGMGKAGYVGMKISATLSSLGFPSFFLHPADAVHGDLGRCRSDDILLILSNSGETPEIARLLPIVKRIGLKTISITASANSTLGTHSDVALEIGKVKEAGPLGLAPTTSTTTMLAIGDAIALTLIDQRGFTAEEFALYHPGGELGRSLLLVQDVMRHGDAHCVVNHKITTREAIHRITETRGRPGAAAVVDDSGVLVGVFTDGNLRRCLELGTEFLAHPISTVMSKNPKTVTSKKLVQETARIMKENTIDQVIVVDSDHHPVGLVDIQDLLSNGIK